MEKLQKRSRAVDRISGLPDSLICCILSFLPTWVVVSTSVLSRRWRFLWTKVPSLDFEYENYKGKMNFVRFVDSVLLHHDVGRLEKFRLQWSKGFKAVYFDKWISYAFSRNVRVLSLELGSHWVERLIHVPLPGTLFTLGTLEFLKLSEFTEVELPCVVCLPKLEVLILDSVEFESKECVPNLISGSPLLHSLTILNSFCNKLDFHSISSPTLRNLEVFYDFTDGEVAIDAPALESLSLHGDISVEFFVEVPKGLKEFKLHIEDDYCYDGGDDFNLVEAHTDRCDSYMRLIEYILMHCAVLKRFNLVWETDSYMLKKLKKIWRLARSSPFCQIEVN